jgi:hypothetical protein
MITAGKRAKTGSAGKAMNGELDLTKLYQAADQISNSSGWEK